MKNLYTNGSIFLVPLKDGGFARGVVARASPDGKLLLGYFFGPRLASQAEADLSGLEPGSAILSLRFGDFGLLKGLWPVVGKLPEWNPAEWPMLKAVRRDPLGKLKPVLVRYDENDPSKRVSEEALKNDIDVPTDGLAGYGFVEAKLTKLLM
ncbi:immunity 26/phosphotriesterase HocA family protein [uncultured Sphingomonas sp.]|uniref:immunity 26/phosphotriesterase HocA family protein n=1 Tax=uncultured Sphingomonas sp. TaxID=158754 RepID=UPI0025F6FFEB|nr:immunity 26/phosphotriesterase HocA family protein [uncultured Sphingomonas sp.]